MAKTLISLIDTDEVKNILAVYFGCDDDKDEKMKLLTKCIEDGTIDGFIYDTFDTWVWEEYWHAVEDSVIEWANDTLDKAEKE